MTVTIAWVLNLDADLELADPDGIAPSSRQRARTEEQGRRFLAAAQANAPKNVRHVRIEDLTDDRADGTTICQSWCPTPRAVELAASRGHSLRGPALEVLQQVNHKSYAADLVGLPYVRSMAELEVRLSTDPARDWLLKRPFGFSGRSRKRITPPMTTTQRTWAEASMSGYGRGLQVEPFEHIENEYALHGWLGKDGTLLRGHPTGLLCDEDGAWLRTTTDPEWSTAESGRVLSAFECCAAALLEAGYRGPFSIDAFQFRDADGGRHLRPMSEVNGRYSMGWFCGMRERQSEWIEHILLQAASR